MARKKPRPYGSGQMIELESGFAVRWRETVIDADGKKRRVLRYENLGNLAKKDAESRAAEVLLNARRSGPRREQPIPTFSELVARYERDILSTKALSTRLVRKTILDVHLIPQFGPVLISNIGTADVQRFFTEMRENGYVKAGAHEQYSQHALHDMRKVMRVVMNWGNLWYHLPADPVTRQHFNPVVGVELKELVPKKEKWNLTDEQAGHLIAQIKHKKAKAMVALAILTGLRREELLALEIGSVSVRILADGTRWGIIKVTRAFYRREFKPPKTKKGFRTVIVHEWVLSMIEDWIQSSKKRRPEDLAFGTRTNRPENPNNILRRKVFPACDALGLPHATWLTFRYTFASLAHDTNEISARTIADIMGHAKVDTQFLFYTQGYDERKQSAGSILGEKLRKIAQNRTNELALVN
jgi:integrase